MDKELIINMLEDTDIKYVIGIDINLELYDKDRVRIDYMNCNKEIKHMEGYFDNSIQKGAGMISYINELYKKEVEDNKELRDWVDKLADFILSNHYQITHVDEQQWNKKKREIVEEICIKKEV